MRTSGSRSGFASQSTGFIRHLGSLTNSCAPTLPRSPFVLAPTPAQSVILHAGGSIALPVGNMCSRGAHHVDSRLMEGSAEPAARRVRGARGIDDGDESDQERVSNRRSFLILLNANASVPGCVGASSSPQDRDVKPQIRDHFFELRSKCLLRGHFVLVAATFSRARRFSGGRVLRAGTLIMKRRGGRS